MRRGGASRNAAIVRHLRAEDLTKSEIDEDGSLAIENEARAR